jgi:hypothetical protein
MFTSDALVEALRKDAVNDQSGTTWAATSSPCWSASAARRCTTS